jgi:hypothetical protein
MSTVHVQLAQAHFKRRDPPASGLALRALVDLWILVGFRFVFDFLIMPPVCIQHRPVSDDCKKIYNDDCSCFDIVPEEGIFAA